MPFEILSLCIAAIALLASPGPATLALAASGAAYGLTKSLGFYIGISLGTAIALTLVSAGLYLVITSSPMLTAVMMGVSILYILYISYQVANAPPVKDSAAACSPGFFPGLILGSTNVKAYAAFAALFAGFTLDMIPSWELFTKVVICLSTCLSFDFLWLYAGNRLRRFFINPVSSRILNRSFAVLIVVAVAASLAMGQ